jgi:MacB-like periplasmic core domain
MRPEHWLYTIPLRVRSLFRWAEADQELADELRDHLERRAEEYVAKGMAPEEARRKALLEIGGIEKCSEECRDARRVNWMQDFFQDLRFGLRMLRKSPVFTAVAVVTLALGIGANTAIFSLTDQILLRELPVPHPEQLVILRSPGPNHGHTWSDVDQGAQSFSYLMYKDLRERATVFSGLLACREATVNVYGHGETERANADLVSGNFFQTLEVQPALGRLFMPGDETASGANTVAVLSYAYWSRKFGADASILNKPLTVNGVPLTVVGVTRKGFYGVQIGSTPDIFIPLTMKAQMAPNMLQKLEDRTDHWLPVMGRLKPGVTLARAEATLQPIYQPILESDAKLLKLSGDELKRFISRPLLLMSGGHGRLVLQEGAQEPLLVLMSMVGLVLLIACANLAGLLVARGEARQREIGVRLAMGARRAPDPPTPYGKSAHRHCRRCRRHRAGPVVLERHHGRHSSGPRHARFREKSRSSRAVVCDCLDARNQHSFRPRSGDARHAPRLAKYIEITNGLAVASLHNHQQLERELMTTVAAPLLPVYRNTPRAN